MGKLALTPNQPIGYFTVIWMKMGELMLIVDELPVNLSPPMMTFFTPNQHVRFLNPEGDYIALQFNREFYCIFLNDHEVSCNGLIFYGSKGIPLLQLGKEDVHRFDLLNQVLLEEFAWRDNIQGEMLRVLLKRWIIMATRIYKMQDFHLSYNDSSIEIIRHFNMLVEEQFKTVHSVSEYANLLHKSPKTLAHLFKQNNQPNPLHIIHSRIALEAKRLLLHTDKTIKEVAYELGFENISSFSRLFKKVVGQSPQAYRVLHYKTGGLEK
ncbi:MAG: AraC family transcriptional regulator [Saprospiraceae bacterium]|nr:MAG: AraC family transcriptional regulator [Saprospiraceae bacterium]